MCRRNFPVNWLLWPQWRLPPLSRRKWLSRQTGKPVEFFKLMPRGKIKLVQTAVLKAMDNSQKAEEVKAQLKSHALKFAAPYTYEGNEKDEL